MTTGLAAITILHTGLSIVALLLGLVVMRDIPAGRLSSAWTKWFLVTAALTSLTGFLFPFHGVTPAIMVAIVALAVLVVAFATWSSRRRHGFRSAGFVVALVMSEYLLTFVGVAQAFDKVPFLHQLAPTLKELPFGVAQGMVLVIFVVIAMLAVRHRSQT